MDPQPQPQSDALMTRRTDDDDDDMVVEEWPSHQLPFVGAGMDEEAQVPFPYPSAPAADAVPAATALPAATTTTSVNPTIITTLDNHEIQQQQQKTKTKKKRDRDGLETVEEKDAYFDVGLQVYCPWPGKKPEYERKKERVRERETKEDLLCFVCFRFCNCRSSHSQ
jgi:hypothetical protein